MPELPPALLQAWQALGHTLGLAQSSAIYATVSALHIIGIALLFGGIAPVGLRFLGALPSLDVRAVVLLQRFAACGLLLAACTGVLLISVKPADYFSSPVVWAKLGLVALATAHALWFHWAHRATGWAQRPGGLLALSGALSLLLWLSVIGLGRWIAFSV
ncbi:hypothetical protein IP84_04060 [beta proteobacterium AAP99]|nr:hypothetical protein IP84_04060 [beta proteobacterium AAP99]